MKNRVTHSYDGELGLFLIGMRIHQPWRLGIVARSFMAMPRMIAELERNKAAAARGEAEHLGYLHAWTMLDGFGPTMVQYWRSVDDIYRYAGNSQHEHRPAWKAFYSYAAKHPDAVTIWHETYAVAAGSHESLYGGPARRARPDRGGGAREQARRARAREDGGAGTARLVMGLGPRQFTQ